MTYGWVVLSNRRKAVVPAAFVHAPLLVLLLTGAACAGGPSPVTSPELGWSETGIASWYGPGFHGRTTANGETYDMDAMTAAHKELPFNTWVRVESLDNGRAIEVRINDRGPFVRGRIIDLSRAAARQIGMIGTGTARVRVVVIRISDLLQCSAVQIGAFGNSANARALVERMRSAGEPVFTEDGPDGLLRVVLGPYSSIAEGEAARARYGGFLRSCK
jgi:rare lipoprotein A